MGGNSLLTSLVSGLATAPLSPRLDAPLPIRHPVRLTS